MKNQKIENIKTEEEIHFEGANPEYKWPIERTMRKLLRENKHLDQDVVYATLATELSNDEIVDKVKEDYSDIVGEDMVKRVKEILGDEYVNLLIEPCISSRIDEFLNFAEAIKREKSVLPSPFEL